MGRADLVHIDGEVGPAANHRSPTRRRDRGGCGSAAERGVADRRGPRSECPASWSAPGSTRTPSNSQQPITRSRPRCRTSISLTLDDPRRQCGPRARGLRERCPLRAHDLRRSAPARLDGAVQVAHPARRGLGSGPVDATDGLAEQTAVSGPGAGAQHSARSNLASTARCSSPSRRRPRGERRADRRAAGSPAGRPRDARPRGSHRAPEHLSPRGRRSTRACRWVGCCRRPPGRGREG